MKKAKLVNSIVLKDNVEFDLKDWHISSKNKDGDTIIHNFEVITTNEDYEKPYVIEAGNWRITPKKGLEPVVFQKPKYYETETSKLLLNKFRVFQKNLHVYDELGLTKKARGLLLGSTVGRGKSSLIQYFCYNLQLKDNSKSCVMFIDNENVDYEVVQKMFKTADKTKVDFIVLIVEDIGGSGLNERRNSIDSTLLNFLDGQDGVFQIPTLIVGTTNYLDDLGQALRRPGRFDDVIEVLPPSDDECVQLIEDFIKRELTKEEKQAIKGKELNPAYLKEAVIRHKLEDISLETAIKDLTKQKIKNDTNTMTKGNTRQKTGFSVFEDDEF